MVAWIFREKLEKVFGDFVKKKSQDFFILLIKNHWTNKLIDLSIENKEKL